MGEHCPSCGRSHTAGGGAAEAVMADLQARVARLTARERETLILVAKGCGEKEIGEIQSIHVCTVRDRKKAVWRKLEVNKMAEAVVIAAKVGLV